MSDEKSFRGERVSTDDRNIKILTDAIMALQNRVDVLENKDLSEENARLRVENEHLLEQLRVERRGYRISSDRLKAENERLRTTMTKNKLSCPTCGIPVRVISSNEGTNCYEPVQPRRVTTDMVRDAFKPEERRYNPDWADNIARRLNRAISQTAR
jgi:hypothetical protein